MARPYTTHPSSLDRDRQSAWLIGRIFAVALAASFVAAVPGPVMAADASGSCSSGLPTRPNSSWIADTIASGSDVDWFEFTTSADKYVQVTLGDLPANYRLDLYAPCGTRLASSNRPGSQYEEIVRHVTAGTYYVRVVSASGASSSSEYALRFRPLGAGVTVLSHSTYVDGIDFRHIVGEVFNNTASKREFVRVTATLYNSSNVVVGTDSTYVWLDIVKPRKRGSFDLLFDPPPGYHHYRLTVSSDATTASPVGNLRVLSGVPYTDVIDFRHYPGEIQNNNSFAIEFTMVIVTLYSDRGAVLNTSFTFTDPDTIASGGKAPYDVTFAERFSANRHVTVVQAERQ